MGNVVPITGRKTTEKNEDEKISLMGKDGILIRFGEVKDDLVRNKLPPAIKYFLDKFESFGSVRGEPRFVCARSLAIYTDTNSPIAATAEYLFCYLSQNFVIRELIVTVTAYRLSKVGVLRRRGMGAYKPDLSKCDHQIKNRVMATLYQCSLETTMRPIVVESNKDAIVVSLDKDGNCHPHGDSEFYLDITEETL